jgi:hypothetical protein
VVSDFQVIPLSLPSWTGAAVGGQGLFHKAGMREKTSIFLSSPSYPPLSLPPWAGAVGGWLERFPAGNAETYKCYPAIGGHSILGHSSIWLSTPRKPIIPISKAAPLSLPSWTGGYQIDRKNSMDYYDLNWIKCLLFIEFIGKSPSRKKLHASRLN